MLADCTCGKTEICQCRSRRALHHRPFTALSPTPHLHNHITSTIPSHPKPHRHATAPTLAMTLIFPHHRRTHSLPAHLHARFRKRRSIALLYLIPSILLLLLLHILHRRNAATRITTTTRASSPAPNLIVVTASSWTYRHFLQSFKSNLQSLRLPHAPLVYWTYARTVSRIISRSHRCSCRNRTLRLRSYAG